MRIAAYSRGLGTKTTSSDMAGCTHEEKQDGGEFKAAIRAHKKEDMGRKNKSVAMIPDLVRPVPPCSAASRGARDMRWALQRHTGDVHHVHCPEHIRLSRLVRRNGQEASAYEPAAVVMCGIVLIPP